MAYSLRQTTGRKADAAKALWQAVKDGKDEQALAIYEAQLDRKWPAHLTIKDNRSWWLINAPDAVRSNTEGLFDAAWAKFGKLSEKAFFEQYRQMAQEKFGGRWVVDWEY